MLEEGETALARAASGRRFLVRTYPTSSGVSVAWRRGGFSIPTHD